MEDEHQKALPCKIILVGDSAVGKTCIIKRFTLNSFDDNEITSSNASNTKKFVSFKEYNNQEILFNVWDTVGQEKYRGLTKLFYHDAKAAILVYDITNADTFKSVKEYWYNQIKNFGEKDVSMFNIYLILKN